MLRGIKIGVVCLLCVLSVWLCLDANKLIDAQQEYIDIEYIEINDVDDYDHWIEKIRESNDPLKDVYLSQIDRFGYVIPFDEVEAWKSEIESFDGIMDVEIVYGNGMEKIIKDWYKERYPNEMGMCIRGHMVDDKLVITGMTEVMGEYEERRNSVYFNCEDGFIELHSHPDIKDIYGNCVPSIADFIVGSIGSSPELSLVVCGDGEKVTEVVVYNPSAYVNEDVYVGEIIITTG